MNVSEKISNKILALCVAAIALLSVSSILLYENHQNNRGGNDPDDIRESVVTILSNKEGYNSSYCTGFIIEHKGSIFVVAFAHKVLTGDDPVEFYDIIVCMFYNSFDEYELNIFSYDTEYDLVLLKFVDDVSAPPLNIGDSDELRYGQYVYTISNQMGLGPTFSSGYVASPYAEIEEYILSFPIIITNVRIDAGSGGAPLVSENNDVVGIMSGLKGWDGVAYIENVSYVIPSNILLEFLSNV